MDACSRGLRTSRHNTFFRLDASAVLLVVSNLFTIVIAVVEDWNFSEVMWIYWGQSVVIGYYNCRRILCLKQFSTEGVRVNDQPVEPTRATQRQAASFFALHYGFFHAVYFGFLYCEHGSLSRIDLIGILVCVGVFGLNHRFSFHRNLERDLRRKPNIGTIMAFPYARIVPMHLTILFGSFFAFAGNAGLLVLFLGLKTLADLIMHQVEHMENRQTASPPNPES